MIEHSGSHSENLGAVQAAQLKLQLYFIADRDAVHSRFRDLGLQFPGFLHCIAVNGCQPEPLHLVIPQGSGIVISGNEPYPPELLGRCEFPDCCDEGTPDPAPLEQRIQR